MGTQETPADYIRRIREMLGKSLRDVARDSQGAVSHGYVAQLESTPGKWSGVTLDTLEGLARGLGIPVEEFVDTIQAMRRGDGSDPLMDLLRRKNVLRREGRTTSRLVPLVHGGFGYPYMNDESEVALVDLFEHFPVDPEPSLDKLIVLADGFCMEPFIFEGDEVLVSIDLDAWRKSGLVAIDVPGEGISVKYLVRAEPDGALRVKQTKPRKEFVMPLGSRVIGRVVHMHRPGGELNKMLAQELSDS